MTPRPCCSARSLRGGPRPLHRGPDPADDALRTKIDYAMGNTVLAMGDVPGRSPLTTSASTRRPAATGWTWSARTPRSTAISPTSRRNPRRSRRARAPTTRHRRDAPTAGVPGPSAGRRGASAGGDDESGPSAGGATARTRPIRTAATGRRRGGPAAGAAAARRRPAPRASRPRIGSTPPSKHQRRPVLPPPPRRAAPRISRQRRPRLVRIHTPGRGDRLRPLEIRPAWSDNAIWFASRSPVPGPVDLTRSHRPAETLADSRAGVTPARTRMK